MMDENEQKCYDNMKDDIVKLRRIISEKNDNIRELVDHNERLMARLDNRDSLSPDEMTIVHVPNDLFNLLSDMLVNVKSVTVKFRRGAIRKK